MSGVASPPSSRELTQCRVCSGLIAPHAGECRLCGTVYGDVHRCPHCRAESGSVQRASGDYVCRICGGPRVPVHDTRVARSDAEAPTLVEARRAQRRAGWFGALTGFTGLASLASLGVAGLAFATNLPGLVVSLVGAALWLAATTFSWGRRRAQLARARVLLRAAWTRVAQDAVASFRAVSARQLSQLLGLGHEEAEALLTQLVVHDLAQSEITQEGRVLYRIATDEPLEAPPRLRVQATESGAEPLDEELALEAPPAKQRLTREP